MSEKVTCDNCQQTFDLCECDFEQIEKQLRNMRNEAYRNEQVDNKNANRESKTYRPLIESKTKGYWKR